MLNFFMKGSRMTLRHEKIQHLPGNKKKTNMQVREDLQLYLFEHASVVPLVLYF